MNKADNPFTIANRCKTILKGLGVDHQRISRETRNALLPNPDVLSEEELIYVETFASLGSFARTGERLKIDPQKNDSMRKKLHRFCMKELKLENKKRDDFRRKIRMAKHFSNNMREETL